MFIGKKKKSKITKTKKKHLASNHGIYIKKKKKLKVDPDLNVKSRDIKFLEKM